MKRAVPFFICDYYLVMNGAALFGMYCARSEGNMSSRTYGMDSAANDWQRHPAGIIRVR